MSIKRVMPVVIGTLMISILIVYVQFQKDIPEDKSAQDQTAVIKVLSCYEIMGQQEILRQFADEFNEQNPGLRVEMEFIDKENLKKDICLREERGDKADMVICDSLEMAGLLDMDVLEDITPYITKERRASVIWPDMWQAVMDDGKYYGIPFSCDPYVLFSNTGYFEKKAL
ncbi:MAG: extracellular solute-binding protein, partial [Clostridium sp.]|nr:extracellular solute-binding protein [Clostridium sp.]